MFAVRWPVLNGTVPCHLRERSFFFVIIDAAAGGVKDLEHQILRFAQNDIPVTIDAAAGGVKDLKEDSLSI